MDACVCLTSTRKASMGVIIGILWRVQIFYVTWAYLMSLISRILECWWRTTSTALPIACKCQAISWCVARMSATIAWRSWKATWVHLWQRPSRSYPRWDGTCTPWESFLQFFGEDSMTCRISTEASSQSTDASSLSGCITPIHTNVSIHTYPERSIPCGWRSAKACRCPRWR